MKKLMTLCLALAMLLTFAVGAMAEEPMEITLAIWNADASLAGDDAMAAIEEKLNIKIVPVNITWDDYVQKIQLWSFSDSLPDVFVGPFRTTATYSQWADQGVIKAIPEDLSKYPTLEAYLSGDAANEAKLNGTLYCLPRQTYPAQHWTTLDRLICYRWDLAQAAGITKEPETWDEFIAMMEAIIAADPDGTGIGGMTATVPTLVNGVIMPYASPLVMDGGAGFKWVKDEDGLYKPAYFVENMVAGFQLARDMYDRGVIEKDIVLNTGDMASEKFLQGKSAAMVISGGFENKFSTVGQYWKEVHGTEYVDDVKILKLMPDVNGNISYSAMASYAWSESYINAKVSDEKLDKILQLWDYLLTDEGAFTALYGPEGVLYDFDENGKVVLKDENTVILEVYPSTDSLGILARWNPSSYDTRFVAAAPASYIAKNLEQVAQAEKVVLPEYYPECTQAFMKMGHDFALNVEDDFLAIMTGEEPVEEMWAEIVAGYEADGLNEVIEMVNAEVK